ncbi:MAG: hypothetical protein PHN75_05885 [Syntrophales bacterium]|nr:hypothetical protein [Syntrophales bacterium]
MKNLKVIVTAAATVFLLGLVPPVNAAETTEEVLLGVKMTPKDIEFQVKTGGCTEKKDFSIEINKGITGNPPYQLTVVRKKKDDCKAFMPEGTIVQFSKKELGLPDGIKLTITNKFGYAF